MKYLDVNRACVNLDGSEIIGGPSGPVRVKDILMQYIGVYPPRDAKGNSLIPNVDGAKRIMVADIGSRLYKHKVGQFEIEDAEFKIIKESIKEVGHGAALMANVDRALLEAEKGGNGPEKEKDPDKAETAPEEKPQKKKKGDK